MVKKCINDFFSREARKVFEGILQYQINLTCRYYPSDAFSIIIVQIEDLKVHNETVIHIMKQKVGDFLAKNSRNSDTIAPLAIDKFVILSPHTNLEMAETFARKLKKLSDAERFDLSFAIGEYDKENEEGKEEFLLRVNKMILNTTEGDARGIIF